MRNAFIFIVLLSAWTINGYAADSAGSVDISVFNVSPENVRLAATKALVTRSYQISEVTDTSVTGDNKGTIASISFAELPKVNVVIKESGKERWLSNLMKDLLVWVVDCSSFE